MGYWWLLVVVLLLLLLLVVGTFVGFFSGGVKTH
jgi:hypothetical protein